MELTDYSSTTVLAVMKYLYAGAICLPKGSVSEIKDLASWLVFSSLHVNIHNVRGGWLEFILQFPAKSYYFHQEMLNVIDIGNFDDIE